MTELHMDRIDSPIGSLLLAWRGETLCALGFDDREERLAAALKSRFGAVTFTSGNGAELFRRRLDEYFAGDLAGLDRIAVDTGGTPFQQSVWRLLRLIPPGTTATYGELAAKLNSPGAARAVGLANGSNPVAIVVPCHRVIGAGGKLVGYGGGLDRKRWLLSHESGGRLR
ncbi:MAG: methylated-DNA--[protein]-cysteine S-methyltransferase [Candidatus Sulfopaludibacter sp.]|nr:methylated-DNA--[protein]-cysteine S-methyltransferase [Candidatus Sulfopaludibacter sp.]